MTARRAAILELLQEAETLNVRQLASRFDVSEMTIRRDLEDLEDRGYLVRTHGGAIATAKLRFLESSVPDYAVSQKKAAIGRRAARLVQPKQTVMVDGGTTTLEVTRNIPQDAGIVIATTSLCVAQILFGSPIDVVILGGMLRKEFPSVYGPITESVLSSFHVDVLFIGCDGAHSVDGFYTTEPRTCAMEQIMIGIADRVVMVTESAKFHQRSFVRFAQPSDVNVLVTDEGLSQNYRANLEERGVEVMVAQEKQPPGEHTDLLGGCTKD